MFNLILEGGVEGMLSILVIGLLMLGRELIRMARLLVFKQHNRKYLSVDTSSVLLGVAALLIISSGMTLMGLYNTLAAVDLKSDYALLVTGSRESIVPLMFATLIASLCTGDHRLRLRWVSFRTSLGQMKREWADTVEL